MPKIVILWDLLKVSFADESLKRFIRSAVLLAISIEKMNDTD